MQWQRVDVSLRLTSRKVTRLLQPSWACDHNIRPAQTLSLQVWTPVQFRHQEAALRQQPFPSFLLRPAQLLRSAWLPMMQFHLSTEVCIFSHRRWSEGLPRGFSAAPSDWSLPLDVWSVATQYDFQLRSRDSSLRLIL
jgi:hypothetical protein